MSELEGPARAVRFDSSGGPSAYKLIRQNDFDELYNLNADPFENADLNTGRCSGNPATACLGDTDCTPPTQPCVLPPPLGSGERDALYGLRVELCSLLLRDNPPSPTCPGAFSAPVTCGSCGYTAPCVSLSMGQSACQLDADSRFCCPSGQMVYRENCPCGSGPLCPVASQRLFCKRPS